MQDIHFAQMKFPVVANNSAIVTTNLQHSVLKTCRLYTLAVLAYLKINISKMIIPDYMSPI